MKLSNFELIETRDKDDLFARYYIAEVDVTTGALWWKKTVRRKLARRFASFWHFADTGKITPGFQAEELARAWLARTGQEC